MEFVTLNIVTLKSFSLNFLFYVSSKHNINMLDQE